MHVQAAVEGCSDAVMFYTMSPNARKLFMLELCISNFLLVGLRLFGLAQELLLLEMPPSLAAALHNISLDT